MAGLMVTKSEESAPSRHALTILAVVSSELLKNGLLYPSKLFTSERYQILAFALVVVAVILYLCADRTEAESSEAERASMFDQQGGDDSMYES